MCATHLAVAWSSLPEQVLLLFPQSFLRFNKSEPWKLRNKCRGNLFPSAPPDAVYMLLHHDMSWQVGSDRLCLFHNALSRPPATAQRPFAPCLGKYAQVLSNVTIGRLFLLYCQVKRSLKYELNIEIISLDEFDSKFCHGADSHGLQMMTVCNH